MHINRSPTSNYLSTPFPQMQDIPATDDNDVGPSYMKCDNPLITCLIVCHKKINTGGIYDSCFN